MKKNKTKKQMCTAGIIALILVAIDQLTKYLAVINLKQSSTGVFVLIPGVSSSDTWKTRVLHLVLICFQ